MEDARYARNRPKASNGAAKGGGYAREVETADLVFIDPDSDALSTIRQGPVLRQFRPAGMRKLC